MKLVAAAAWFVLVGAAVACAEEGARATPAASVTGSFFALSVADLEASTRWYVEKLGLTVVRPPATFEKSTAVVLEGGGMVVELIHHDDAVPLAAAAPGRNKILVHGPVKAGAIVADFEKTLTTLRQRNVRIAFGPYPARADQRANVIVEDNAGNLIQFFGGRTGAR